MTNLTKIEAYGHIRADRKQFKIEIINVTGFGSAVGGIDGELIARGYQDTHNDITGYQLTTGASNAKAEAAWLASKNIPLKAGREYK